MNNDDLVKAKLWESAITCGTHLLLANYIAFISDQKQNQREA